MKKKILSTLILTIFLVSFVFTIAHGTASSSKVKVSVYLKSVSCEYNNHVGNEWSYNSSANGKDLSEGESIEISTTSSGKITVVSEMFEDDSIPDYGSGTLSISVSSLKASGKTYTSQVIVTENRGRYSGKTAAWKFTYVIRKK